MSEVHSCLEDLKEQVLLPRHARSVAAYCKVDHAMQLVSIRVSSCYTDPTSIKDP